MIGKEPCFEDVVVDEEIPPLVKPALTTRQLVMYAGATGDFNEIHYDDARAKAYGLPAVIAHGLLKCAFLGQMLNDWLGANGTIKKFGCTYRGMDVPGDVVTCRGRVTNKYVRDGENIVELDIWVENQYGQIKTPGTAAVSLRTARRRD